MVNFQGLEVFPVFRCLEKRGNLEKQVVDKNGPKPRHKRRKNYEILDYLK